MLIAVLGAPVMLAAYALWYANTPVRVGGLPVEFEFPPGTGLRGAARVLERAGIEVQLLPFELLARATGRATAIKAGIYELARPASPRQLLDKLTRGEIRTVPRRRL
jgi:UPF0755 protein